MGAIVAFNYQSFAARYPQFAAIPEATIQACWEEATIYHSNNGSGPVATTTSQQALLNMVTAHICFLSFGENNQPASPIVGHINSASEGSVSVSADNEYPPGSAQWWQQSKYGSQYWLATAQYRTMQYRPGQSRAVNPWMYYGRGR